MATATYEQGMVDAIETYGETCLKYIGRGCDGCPIGHKAGSSEFACIKMAKDNPKNFVTALRETATDVHTYRDEFAVRHPASALSTEELVAVNMCRKIIFDGNFSCDKLSEEACTLCWEQAYEGDGAYTDEETSGSKKQNDNPFA